MGRATVNEADVTHSIIKALNCIPGVWVWRRNVGRRGGVQFGKRGQADIEGVSRPGGRRIEIEVKLDAKVTAEQTQWLEQMRGYGAIVGVVHGIDEAIDLVVRARASG
jgi:hypothetical protein